jgi:hypothetical protein
VRSCEYATLVVPFGVDVGVIPMREESGITLFDAEELAEVPTPFVAVTTKL